MMNNQLITILGPTASGKTAVAVRLAAEIGGEIISADSRQVYRRMDIGTGKDLSEYRAPSHPPLFRGGALFSQTSPVLIPYHLIDICEPGTKYNLYQYQQDFQRAYQDIRSRGAVPILCGGTGLYIEAVLKGYQLAPVSENKELRASLEGKSLEELTEILRELKRKNGTNMHNTTDVDTAQRAIRAIEIEVGDPLKSPTTPSKPPRGEASALQLSPLGGTQGGGIFGLSIDRELRREKITRRLKARLDEGMVDEIRGLLDSGIPAEDLIYYGLEYKYVTQYVIGQLSYDEMFRQLEIAIHQFAKRQMTWFRGMERRGFTIHWIDATLPMEEKVQQILHLL